MTNILLKKLEDSIVVYLCVGIIVILPFSAFTQRLLVSENQRFLVTEDGVPFFWMGDLINKW